MLLFIKMPLIYHMPVTLVTRQICNFLSTFVIFNTAVCSFASYATCGQVSEHGATCEVSTSFIGHMYTRIYVCAKVCRPMCTHVCIHLEKCVCIYRLICCIWLCDVKGHQERPQHIS